MWKKFKNWVILNIHTPKIYLHLARRGIMQTLTDRGLLQELQEANYITDYKNHVAKYCLHNALLFAKAGRPKYTLKGQKWLERKKVPYTINASTLNNIIILMLEKDLELFMRGN